MPRKAYTRPQKEAAIALARTMGAEAAADLLDMDRRTVTGWLAKAPARDDVEGWHAAQQLAQEQLLGQLATGRVKHPVTLATVSGIASRNVRYAAVIREREQRRAAEQVPDASSLPLRRRGQWDAIHAAIGGHLWGDESTVSRYQRHTAAQLFDAIDAVDDGLPMPETDWSSVAWLALQREALDAPRDGQLRDRAELEWHYLPDADYADDERYQVELDAIAVELEAAAAAWLPSHVAELATHKVYRVGRYYTVLTAEGERVLSGMTYLPAEYADHPIDADSEPLTGAVLPPATDRERWMVNVTPEPAIAPVVAHPRPPVTVLEAGEHLEDHPSWRRIE